MDETSDELPANVAPAATMEFTPGSTLGVYVILDRLGRGATSTVYRAHHPALDREVAIKILWSPLADDPDFQERFRREARSVSRLRHPNVLTVYDFGTHNDITYMVMELLPGGTLADRLGEPLPLEDVERILRSVAAAVDHAHSSGLIHRDIKPSNILFTRNDEPVLSDFGIARLVDQTGYATGGGVKGTPTYMSPEQASGKEVVAASDLYSLGVVLFQMVTGRPPFQSENWVSLMRSHAEEVPPFARTFNPRLPSAVEEVLTKALAKDPEDRYETGAALTAAFAEARLKEDETPTPLRIPPLDESMPTAVIDDRADETIEAGFGDTTPIRGAPLTPPPLAPPAPLPPPRQRSLAPLALLLAVLLLSVVAGALIGIALWERQFGAFWGPSVANAPPPTPTQPPIAVIQQPPAAPAAQPTSAPPPPPPTLAIPTPVGRSTGSPEPIPPSAPPVFPPAAQPPANTGPRGPLAVVMLSPADGDEVPPRPVIRGQRSGLQGPDEHLWLLVQPQGSNDLWWPYQRELIADANGVWEVRDAEIGGPVGIRHELLVGMVDAAGHRELVRHVEERPGQPLANGFPAGFRPLARIAIVKGAG
jgi:serine/threonine-protein kinase